MDFDTERGRQKSHELVDIAERALQQQGHTAADEARRLATAIVENLADVEPPEAPPIVLHNIAMRSGGYGGARSTKPGNIRLNLGKFVSALASGVLTIVGVTSAPWTALFAAIVLWDQLWSSLKVEVSQADAAVLWAMWTNRDKDHEITQDGLLEKVNLEISRVGHNRITQRQLNDSL